MKGLTERQQEILDFLKGRRRTIVDATIREIGAELGIGSPNGVNGHLLALERKGLIRRGGRSRTRGIEIVEN